MKDKDIFKDIFSEKLGNHEVKVNPELWSTISSKIATSTVATGTSVGISLLSKIVIGGSVVAAISIGTYLIYPSVKTNSSKKEIKNIPIQSKDTSSKINSRKIEKNGVDVTPIIISFPPSHSICKDLISSDPFTIETKETAIKILFENKELILDKIISDNNLVKTEENKEIKNNVIENNIAPSSYSTESNQNESSIEELPNIFTPNFDGINDELRINSNGLRDFSLVILDSKSQIIYRSEDPNFNWNGIKLNGEMIEEGNYLYYITAYDSNGKAVNKYSSLKVVR